MLLGSCTDCHCHNWSFKRPQAARPNAFLNPWQLKGPVWNPHAPANLHKQGWNCSRWPFIHIYPHVCPQNRNIFFHFSFEPVSNHLPGFIWAKRNTSQACFFKNVISIRIPNLYRMLLNDSLLMKIMGIPSGNMLFSRRISISGASHKASFPVRGTMGVLLGFHGFCRTDWAHYFHEYVTSLSVFFPHFHCAYHYPLQFLPWSMVKSCGFWAGQTLFSNTWPLNSWNMFHEAQASGALTLLIPVTIRLQTS